MITTLLPPGSARRERVKEIVRLFSGMISPIRILAVRRRKVPKESPYYFETAFWERERSGSGVITLPDSKKPVLSIIVPVYDQWHHTRRALISIARTVTDIPCEVIIADDASPDGTAQIEQCTVNAIILRAEKNVGFLRNCSNASRRAKGDYILFMNNDAELLPGTCRALIDVMRSEDIGVVGGRLLFPDGRLQEAGSVLRTDGTAGGYGRMDHPFKPEYSFMRDVDYVSGALFCTPRVLFAQLKGFDELYAPAYYEESDYCMRVRKAGLRVVYTPFANAVHHEFQSMPAADALARQAVNRRKFLARWEKELAVRCPAGERDLFPYRSVPDKRPRVLFIEDRIPDPAVGSGMPRSYDIVTRLVSLGCFVSVCPTRMRSRADIAADLARRGVEVFHDEYADVKRILKARNAYYDIIFIARPGNMAAYGDACRRLSPRSRIIYDAEAIFAFRDARFREVTGRAMPLREREIAVAKELALAKKADMVTAVSDAEGRIFSEAGVASVTTLGHALAVKPSSSFRARQGILFAGSILSTAPHSPNYDALTWFIREIFPVIRQSLGATVTIAGNVTDEVVSLAREGLIVTGYVPDLGTLFASHRVFVVPTRFAGGIPYKLHHASSFGIPSVVTPLIAEQVGWRNGYEVMVGDTPEMFARAVHDLYTDERSWNRMQRAMLMRMRRDCSEHAFTSALAGVIKV
ncbi:MAG: glycosyltransferase [Spirochaetota bacterium]